MVSVGTNLMMYTEIIFPWCFILLLRRVDSKQAICIDYYKNLEWIVDTNDQAK